MICVSIVTAYLVLPPLYSVIQTSLFTTKLTGEIDQFTLRYYEDLFRELQIIGPFLNTFYFSIGSALCATLLGGSIAWIVVRTDSPLRGLGYFTAFASFGTPFILYTIGWLLLLGKAGPVNYWLKILLRPNRTGAQRLFHVRHDFDRVAALVAVCFSHARRGVSLHGPVSRGSVGGLRRAGLADHAADFLAPDAAGVLLGHAVDLHPHFRILRDSRFGRTSGRYSRADDVDLSRRAKTAAAVRQRRRVFGAVDGGGGGDAVFLFSSDPRRRPLPHRDGQRLPARR